MRADYWPAAIEIFKDCIRCGGQGPGHFDSEFARYRPPTVQIRPVYVHNDYLNTLCEWGATGLAIIVAACALLYYGALKTWPAIAPGRLGSRWIAQKQQVGVSHGRLHGAAGHPVSFGGGF